MQPRSPQGPIQKSFAGLLGYLGLTGAQLVPNAIGGVTEPGIDVEKYLLAGQLKATTFTNPALPIIATSATFALPVGCEVPEGKAWVIRHIGGWLDMDAGDTLKSFGLSIASGAGAGNSVTQLCNVVGEWAPATAALAQVGFEPSQLMVLPAGWRIGINYTEAVFAVALPFRVSLVYAEVQL